MTACHVVHRLQLRGALPKAAHGCVVNVQTFMGSDVPKAGI
jgi:hypothetical protein